jgi:hypothetical protein
MSCPKSINFGGMPKKRCAGLAKSKIENDRLILVDLAHAWNMAADYHEAAEKKAA